MMATRPLPTLLVLASTYPRWTGDHEPGFVHELARRLVGRFRVLALVPHAPGAKQRQVLDGVEVVRYRYAPESLETLVNDGGILANLRRHKWKWLLIPSFVLAQAWSVRRLLKSERVGIIHAHWMLPQGFVAAVASQGRHKAPFVVTSHGVDLHGLRGPVLDFLKQVVVRRAAAVTVVSHAMSKQIQRREAFGNKISIQPMGVDLSGRFTPAVGPSRVPHRILFVGRLVEKKGVCHLLAALPLVRKQIPDALVTIAGFGPEEEALRNQARALGIADAVEFLGPVPQASLPGLYRSSALFVAPFVRASSGDEEGLGLVLIEAAGCGCPVLAGDVPAVKDIFGDEFAEMQLDPRDVPALARAIIGVLTEPERARARAAQLRDELVERFDWRAVASRYTRLLQDAEQGHAP